MKKVFDYKRHADDCRALANKMDSGEQRAQLLEMAATWEKLAAERSKQRRTEEGAPRPGRDPSGSRGRGI